MAPPVRIGPLVRRAFGPFEPAVAAAYRRAFFDVRTLASLVARGSPARVLEIGCGDGAVAEALAEAHPRASYVGIDIAPDPGRLYAGDRARVEFHTAAIEPFAAAHQGDPFDVVLVCDVLHHVAPDARRRFLEASASLVRPGGSFVLKEWERRTNPVHLAVWFSDRAITGDRIRFEAAGALRSLLSEALPAFSLESEHRLPPWRNNVAFILRSR